MIEPNYLSQSDFNYSYNIGNDYLITQPSTMPSSMLNFVDVERTTTGLDDSQALKLAVELSMLGMGDQLGFNATNTAIHPSLDIVDFNTRTMDFAKLTSALNSQLGSFMDDPKQKKSQNMTECVPVPSSEHVAEIVGRQGCKIKALRTKTNTYIKTPVRGEEPVFVVTGRKEDVSKAKKEILSAAEHFSQIRASRRNLSGLSSGTSTPPGSLNGLSPGHVTVHVRVPYRVVGLVVGPKGATIKRIQQQTHTYIVTPSRDKDPVFEVTGLPDNVETARKEIESHIAVRTNNGTVINSPTDLGVDEVRSALKDYDLFQSLYRTSLGPLFTIENGNLTNDSTATTNSSSKKNNSSFSVGSTSSSSGIFSSLSDCSHSACSSSNSSLNGSNNNNGCRLSDLVSIWNPTTTTTSSSCERDDNLVDFTNLEPSSTTTASLTPNIWSYTNQSLRPPQFQVPTTTTTSITNTKCNICNENIVQAALIPCGHNLFCLDCANQVCNSKEAVCPICKTAAIQVLRIFV